MNQTTAPAIDGVIFDLDGTLLDTLASLANCYNRVLTRLGHPTHATDAYRYFIGDGARRCMERCLPMTAQTSEQIAEALALQQLDYASNWQRDAVAYEGVQTMLAAHARRGIPLAVLSNKDQAFTQACVEHFFPDVSFQAVVGYSTDIPHKPDPTGARHIASALKLDCSRLALLGDTAMDMQTAATCGMTALGALWGFRDEKELQENGAHHLLQHPDELSKLTFSD